MTWTDIALAALWVVFWIYWLASAFSAKKTVRNKSQGWLVSRIILLVLIAAVIKVPALKAYFKGSLIPPSQAANVAGVLICALGLAFAVWARIHLGRNWGMPMTMREEPELVTTGPYRFVRHPIYSGILLALLGTLVVGKIVWLFAVFFAAYFIYSARTEERLMAQQFPEQYPQYKMRTKMIVPFLF